MAVFPMENPVQRGNKCSPGVYVGGTDPFSDYPGFRVWAYTVAVYPDLCAVEGCISGAGN